MLLNDNSAFNNNQLWHDWSCFLRKITTIWLRVNPCNIMCIIVQLRPYGPCKMISRSAKSFVAGLQLIASYNVHYVKCFTPAKFVRRFCFCFSFGLSADSLNGKQFIFFTLQTWRVDGGILNWNLDAMILNKNAVPPHYCSNS